MNVLALCAGIGGLELGIKIVCDARTICYVEGEAYASSVLVRRMDEGWLDKAPIWSDMRTFDGCPWRGVVDCITAGFPCQPVSRVGRRQGKEHAEWLWDHVLRVIEESASPIVFCENVDAMRSNGGTQIVSDLASRGFDVAWDLFSARRIGAAHTRPRLFILATKRDRMDHSLCRRRWTAAEALFPGRERPFPASPGILSGDPQLRTLWPEPGLPGCHDGSAAGVDRHRLRAGGNAVVPLVASYAWCVLHLDLRRREGEAIS